MKRLAAGALSLLLLAACSRGDEAAEQPGEEITGKFSSGHFLQYFNKLPSLAPGDYTLVIAPATGGAGDYTLSVSVNEAVAQSFSGNWSAAASVDPADVDNPDHAVNLDRAGGLKAELAASSPACLYLLDRAGNILDRAGDDAGTTDVCDTGVTAASLDLPVSRTNDESYARAYYATIDPADDRATIADWKSANGFDAGETAHVIFRDTKDLGYGRDMHFRDNQDGTYAFFVNNYVVTNLPGTTYGPLNLNAAIAQESKYHLGTNAIEFGPIDADGDLQPDDVNGDGISDAQDYFPRFYNFSSTPPYERKLTVDLDGKGEKAMPVPCIVCHGGRADTLLPDGSFPRSGDTLAHLQPLDVGTFEYSNQSPWTRAEMELDLKLINRATYDSYASSLSTVNSAGEWNSDMARELLENWYGGADLPGTFNDTYLPSGWQPDPNDGTPPSGADSLYHDLLSTNCRTCHLLRGQDAQSDIDFTSWDTFIGYSGRIEELVFDQGLMPLATLTFDNFFEQTGLAEMLASFLPDFSRFDSDGALLLPGRPIANAGPDRSSPSPVVLSGTASVFAAGYAWSIQSMPTGAIASLAGSDQIRPALTASLDGEYVLSLTVTDGSRTSAADTVTITVDSSMIPAPADITFSTDIQPVLNANCVTCHQSGGNGSLLPPVFYSAPGPGENRDVYDTVRSLVDFNDPENSRLLLKPAGNHHAGGTVTGFDLAGGRSNYDLFLNWILEGAREE